MDRLMLEQYWERIGFTPCPGESRESQLIRLHRCHSFAIPFENLDSFCGIAISLSFEDVYKKIIEGRRGGYCFELNLLFKNLLDAMGYEVSSVLCRPFTGEGERLPLVHRMLIVNIQQSVWVADVGLGGNGWIDPLRLQPDIVQSQFGRKFRILTDNKEGFLVQVKRAGRYTNAVAFDFVFATEADFEISNYYTSTHPESLFVKRLICTLPTENGRFSIRDKVFKTDRDGTTTAESLDVHLLPEIFSDYFSVVLTGQMYESMRLRV